MIVTRNVAVTPDDHGPLVNLASWISVVIMILAVFTRLGSKFVIVRRLGKDDALIITAAIVAIAQTITVSLEVSYGLGRHIDTLDPSQIEKFQKTHYAADLLFITALAFAKASIIIYLFQLTPRKFYLLLNKSSMGVVAVWAVVAIIGLSFQCKLPRAWAFLSNQCINQSAFWVFVGAFDVVTEIVIVALPTIIVTSLQMPRGRKAVVVGAFTCRFIFIPLIILRLVYIASSYRSTDQTYDSFNTAICTQIYLNLGVFIANVPFLKVFLEGLPAECLKPQSAYDTYASGKGSKNSSFALASILRSRNLEPKNKEVAQDPPLIPNEAPTNATVVTHPSNAPVDGYDSEPRTSTGSDRMIIKQTKAFSVQYEQGQQGQQGPQGPPGRERLQEEGRVPVPSQVSQKVAFSPGTAA